MREVLWFWVCWVSLRPPAADTHASIHLLYTKTAGAAHCPDEVAIRNAVAARLGYEPWDPRSQRIMIVEIRKQQAAGDAAVIDDWSAKDKKQLLVSKGIWFR